MALADEPDEHIEYIAEGAAAGVLAGIAYGLVTRTSGDSYAEEKPGFQWPALQVVKVSEKISGKKEIVRVVNLVRYKF
jgi:hypothetical protein